MAIDTCWSCPLLRLGDDANGLSFVVAFFEPCVGIAMAFRRIGAGMRRMAAGYGWGVQGMVPARAMFNSFGRRLRCGRSGLRLH